MADDKILPLRVLQRRHLFKQPLEYLVKHRAVATGRLHERWMTLSALVAYPTGRTLLKAFKRTKVHQMGVDVYLGKRRSLVSVKLSTPQSVAVGGASNSDPTRPHSVSNRKSTNGATELPASRHASPANGSPDLGRMGGASGRGGGVSASEVESSGISSAIPNRLTGARSGGKKRSIAEISRGGALGAKGGQFKKRHIDGATTTNLEGVGGWRKAQRGGGICGKGTSDGPGRSKPRRLGDATRRQGRDVSSEKRAHRRKNGIVSTLSPRQRESGTVGSSSNSEIDGVAATTSLVNYDEDSSRWSSSSDEILYALAGEQKRTDDVSSKGDHPRGGQGGNKPVSDPEAMKRRRAEARREQRRRKREREAMGGGGEGGAAINDSDSEVKFKVNQRSSLALMPSLRREGGVAKATRVKGASVGQLKRDSKSFPSGGTVLPLSPHWPIPPQRSRSFTASLIPPSLNISRRPPSHHHHPRLPNSADGTSPPESEMAVSSLKFPSGGACTGITGANRRKGGSNSASAEGGRRAAIEEGGDSDSENAGGGMERRVSVRQTENAFKFKDISVRRCAGYMHVVIMSQGGRGGVGSSSAKNSLGPRVLQELSLVLHNARYDETSRVVLLSGSGNVFCSGVDLHYLVGTGGGATVGQGSEGERRAAVKQLVDCLREFISALISFPKPLVAAVNGPAVGLGVALLPLCDIVYASDKASFCCPYSALGQTPEGCASHTFPPMMGMAMANELLLRGRKITALEASQVGLVTQVFWPDQLMSLVTPRVQTLAAQSGKAMESTKALMRGGQRATLEAVNATETQLLLERWTAPECLRAIQCHLDSCAGDTF